MKPSFLAHCWLTRQFHVITNNNSHATNDGAGECGWMVDSAAFRGVMAINNCCMNEAKSGQDIEANDCQRTQITEHAKCGWGRGWGAVLFPPASSTLMLKIVPSKIMRGREILPRWHLECNIRHLLAQDKALDDGNYPGQWKSEPVVGSLWFPELKLETVKVGGGGVGWRGGERKSKVNIDKWRCSNGAIEMSKCLHSNENKK